MNLVEAQIKQDEEDRKHEEEYAKMEIVLQNNLMRTKVFLGFLFPGAQFINNGPWSPWLDHWSDSNLESMAWTIKMILGLR